LSSFTRLFYFFAGSSFFAEADAAGFAASTFGVSTLAVFVAAAGLAACSSFLAGVAAVVGAVVVTVAAGVTAGFAASVLANADTAKVVLTRIALINLVIK